MLPQHVDVSLFKLSGVCSHGALVVHWCVRRATSQPRRIRNTDCVYYGHVSSVSMMLAA